MYVKFWGTRGSIANAGPSTLRYGGNTSCVELRADDGTLIVIDCGTGAYALGQELIAQANGLPVDGNILVSHTHWDHIQGLPFFAPLFEAANTWHIYGPRGLGTSLSETLAGQMQYTYFPVTIEQLGATVDYHDLVEGAFDVGNIKVTAQYLNHPALTLGYRLEVDGATVVYASDHEPHHRDLARGGDVGSDLQDRAHARFALGADLLIHDAQYLSTEYSAKVGWGHSTAEYVIDVAHHAGVRRVALFHHDPGRTDGAVDELVTRARAYGTASGYEGEIFAAAEGMRIDLRGDPASPRASRRPFAIATMKPALESSPRSVLMAVRTPMAAAILRDAAVAEGLEIFEAPDRAACLEIAHTHQPALIVIEDDAGVGGDDDDLLRAIRELDPPYGREVGLVTVGQTGIRLRGGDDDDAISGRLVWPFSAGYVRTRFRAWLLRRACRWQNAPLPPDEERRLRSLRALGILDTEPEQRFDRYTAQASASFDMPIALVSLVDSDRQWFKSHHGTDVVETPRDVSVCAHAILGDGVFQVPDALDDPRFADNPMVVNEPRARFYAGVPLTLADGTRAGTLCVVDTRPRLLDEQQLDELRRLGKLVASELERH